MQQSTVDDADLHCRRDGAHTARPSWKASGYPREPQIARRPPAYGSVATVTTTLGIPCVAVGDGCIGNRLLSPSSTATDRATTKGAPSDWQPERDHADPALRVERCSVQLPPSADEGMCIIMMGAQLRNRAPVLLTLPILAIRGCERLFRDQAVAPGAGARSAWRALPRSMEIAPRVRGGIPTATIALGPRPQRRCWSS